MIKISDHSFLNKNTVQSEGNSFVITFIEKNRSVFLISVPVCILLAMTIPISSRPYWDDEIFSILTAKSWEGMITVFHKYENNMAFYYVILHLWMKLFGEGEMSTRFLSIFISLLSVYFFYALSCKVFNKTIAFFATILLVSHPIFLFYAVETRSYCLLLMLAIVATSVYLKILQKPTLWWGFLYSLIVGAAVYSHYFGILIVPVHLIALSMIRLNRKLLTVFLLSLLFIVFLLLPLMIFPPASLAQVDWMQVPALSNLLSVYIVLFGGKYLLLILIMCAILTFMQLNQKKLSVRKISFLPVLSISWIFLPTLFAFLISVLIKPAFLDRYFILCLPAVIFIIAMAIIHLQITAIWKSCIFLGATSILLVQAYQKLLPKGSGYKEAAVFLSNEVKPDDAVIAYPFYKAIHYSYYLSAIKKAQPYLEAESISSGAFLPGGGGRDPDPDFSRITQISNSSKRVFIICLMAKREADPRQNREWLARIAKEISLKHPLQKRVICMPNSLEPVMVLIFE